MRGTGGYLKAHMRKRAPGDHEYSKESREQRMGLSHQQYLEGGQRGGTIKVK